MICKPKKQGGLGVLNLRIQNKALLMKNLYKFYNHMDIPWVNLIWQAYYSNGYAPHASSQLGSFWWRDCMSYNDSFRDITSCTINNGQSIQLWKDKWSESIREYDMPHLFSFARDQNVNVAVTRNISMEQLYDLFQLPLSVITHDQMHNLFKNIQTIQFNDAHDI